MDLLLNFEPPGGEQIAQIHWHPCMFDQPLYQRSDGHIWSFSTYCSRLRDLGFRAGYAQPPTNHDFRAEGLHSIGELFSTASYNFASFD